MSTETSSRGHRHSRSAAMPASSASSQNPQNPHHLNQQAHLRNSQSERKSNKQGASSQSTTPPQTPRRDNQPASQNTNTNTLESGSKHKSRNKNRLKNVNVSPAVMRNGRSTPPLIGAQSTGIPFSGRPSNTTSTAAYAGPTFHASPAPSALPIPSFYSKSVPDSPGVKGFKSVKEPLLKETPSPSSHFTPPPANNPLQREESPLDFFFRADREEKARARSASSTQTAVAPTGPFQPPIESPRSSQTPPALPTLSRPRQGHSSKISASGMFAMELDGEPEAGTVYGPAFSTPYAQRIRAARASSEPVQSIEQPRRDLQQSLNKSEALKAYLFSDHAGLNLSNATPVPPQDSALSGLHQNPSAHATGPRSAGAPGRPYYSNYSQEFSDQNSRQFVRSSGLRQEVTPTKTPTRTPDLIGPYSHSQQLFSNPSPSPASVFDSISTSPSHPSPTGLSSESKTTDIQGMEESLRRILKLDSARSSDIIGGSLPAASSVPNYVGGRPPPMNGRHNGVMGS